MFSVAKLDIPIALTPFWPIMCFTGLHEDDETVVAFLRERDVRLVIYLDDTLIISNDPIILNSQLCLLRELFQVLRLVIDEKKFPPKRNVL